MRGRQRAHPAVTLVELMIAFALLSILAMILMDLLTSETRTTAQLMDDLTLNKEARALFQAVSRDVRSAFSIELPAAGQINPDPIRVGMDETLGQLILSSRVTLADGAGKLKKIWIRYRLVGKGQQPPRSRPEARAKSIPFGSGGDKWVFPLLRELWVNDPKSGGSATEVLLIGWVRGLSFYQFRPAGWQVSQPTVCMRATMSAFKPNPSGPGFVETYREDLSTVLTARGILPMVVDKPPDASRNTSEDVTTDGEG